MRHGLVAVVLLGAAALLGCGGPGRVVNLPRNFSLAGRTLRLTAAGQTAATASPSPLHAPLLAALRSIDCVPLVVMAARHSLPERLKAMADRGAGRPLQLTTQVDKLDLYQVKGDTVWWLRVDVSGTLVDPGDYGRQLWRHAVRQTQEVALHGRALRGLLAENLVEGNAASLKRELSLHLRDVLTQLLADLDRLLHEAGGQPAPGQPAPGQPAPPPAP